MSTSSFEKELIRESCRQTRPSRILEIGVFKGETTAVLARAAFEYGGEVVGIDPMTWAAELIGNGLRRHLPTSVGPALDVVERLLGQRSYERDFWQRVDGLTNVTLLQMKSTDPDLLGSDDPRLKEFDLVFIDGDHSYAAVRSDLRHWARRVRVGGRVLVHDATPRFPGVCRALREWAAESCVALEWPRRDSLCVAEILGRASAAAARSDDAALPLVHDLVAG